MLSKNANKYCKTIILPVGFYGCETRPHIKEESFWVFTNRVLGKIFVPEREKITGGWSKLRKEELHNL
jgi:hypothetical protein